MWIEVCCPKIYKRLCLRCPSGKFCQNKRIQKRNYARLEPFYTGVKGWGLRAKTDILKGAFIMEYVGEVIDRKEMMERFQRYSKDPNYKHTYFMELKRGCIIDSTVRGNLTRFINHSCDPNVETQRVSIIYFY